MRQQPIYLEDARGVLAPFHLEFVTSVQVLSHAISSRVSNGDLITDKPTQVLIYALKSRYSKGGARKVEQGKFAITDARTNRDIDLSGDWMACFRPGQRVNMSLC